MKLTKEQVEMIKNDSETTNIKHGYDMTIIQLCDDWLEMYGEIEMFEEENEEIVKTMGLIVNRYKT